MSLVSLDDCFIRINNPILIDQSLKDIKSNLHMSHDKWQKYGLSLKKSEDYDAALASTYEVSEEIRSIILSTIPNGLLSLEIPHVWYLEVTGTDKDITMVPPHIDSFRICTINYYINTNGETTHYYDYKASKIEEIGRFCAKINECWILNTKNPHSVTLKSNKTRSVIGASFVHTPYDKVVSFFS